MSKCVFFLFCVLCVCTHIQDCLPVCLMFDIREDGEADPCKLAQMMQNLGVFISVKPKVKQTSKVQLYRRRFAACPHNLLSSRPLFCYDGTSLTKY